MIRLVAILSCLLVMGPALASEPDAADFDGRWKLDKSRSDPFGPVMKTLEISWLVRRVAAAGSVHIQLTSLPPECDVCPARIQMDTESAFASSSAVAILDGIERPGSDPAGNDTVDAYSWVNGGIELARTRTLGSGSVALIRDHRSIGDDANTMTSVLTIWVDGEKRISARRIFVRVT